ncbi:nucleotidyltransferase family protein [Nocardioides alcanivorans]|uniref:nucleotidyltransferase family protein n=1 Tax=Nocardioides alcanivorans TaxID=2897352 RepID=UPI001F382393|nr:nucleotidyltransferase family protein [Nocardioides alcanivorans]
MTVVGLLLAAGAGSRMGQPKALVHDREGSWLLRSVEVLLEGGCDAVRVVLGAAYDDAAALLARHSDPRVTPVRSLDWAEGMSASLHDGLVGLADDVDAVVVHLVDLPDVGADVVAALLTGGAEARRLARAAYDGRPGHPVLIGRSHWAGVRDSLAGDEGAKGYLRAHDHELVECGHLAGGHDVDSWGGPTPHQRRSG